VKTEEPRVAEDLETELLNDSKPSKGCMVCTWLDGRDDAGQWDRAFSNPAITGAALQRGMNSRGFRGKMNPVTTHRREQHRVD